MRIEQIQKALEAAYQLSNHHEYVIAGSLSVLGAIEESPELMSMSTDIDFFPLQDPGRASEIANVLGEGSEFHIRNGYYLDAISPDLPTLPNEWESRLVKHVLNGITTYFLDVNDTAISKYTRGAENDFRWIEAGYNANILRIDVIESRMRFMTDFFDLSEKHNAFSRFHMHQRAMLPSGVLDNNLLNFLHKNKLEDGIKEIDAEHGSYEGKILWASDLFIVQSLGRGKSAIHDSSKLDVVPAAESHARFNYIDGQLEVTPAQQNGLSLDS
ncbi:DUF6036 family nucleotidyltransferase [Methylotenera sp.]|uniref:DUF6036 family nucleotidyltransferase n=1 Tax=Methylotenera sp. TaxID=2051956 RepID=UPI002EDB9C1F